nr:formylglycine-generating enzyme family protein [Granulicella aggregans]
MKTERDSCCTPQMAGGRSMRGQPITAREPCAAMMGLSVPLAGGTFLMGTDDSTFPNDGEGPVRPVTLSPFHMGRIPVTNELFAIFVRATGYLTDAETLGSSFVVRAHLTPELQGAQPTVLGAPWWCSVAHACWHAPEGIGSSLIGRGGHPVVHVSWNDALAFCHWSGQRLPTEAEWEYAARGGLKQKLYPWGDDLEPDGRHLCNIWQGQFPTHDEAADGYAGTCPVQAFPANSFGLYSMTGNTWEWCADWFGTDRTFLLDKVNPKGPRTGASRVLKGGSFLCHASYCNRYRVAARSSNTPQSSASNIGFRCASS